MSDCCDGDAKTPKVILATGVVPASKELMRRAGVAAVLMWADLKVISGDRSPQKAWYLRNGYLRGWSGFNLAARCCDYYGIHSWLYCGKTPRSLHASGRAIDCGFISPHNGSYTSFMKYPGAYDIAKIAGLKAPLWPPWNTKLEAWHMTLA